MFPLPAHPFETELVRAVRSARTPYVRFDRNFYSIPHTHVRKPLTLEPDNVYHADIDQITMTTAAQSSITNLGSLLLFALRHHTSDVALTRHPSRHNAPQKTLVVLSLEGLSD